MIALIVIGAVFAFLGVILFVLFRTRATQLNTVKFFGVELESAHPELINFIIGAAMITIAFTPLVGDDPNPAASPPPPVAAPPPPGAAPPPPVDSPLAMMVSVDPPSLAVTEGNGDQLIATVKDNLGQPVVGVAPTWSSADMTIVTVDETGWVTGLKAGGADIIATAGQASGLARISVLEPVLTSISFPSRKPQIVLGERKFLDAFDQTDMPMAVGVSWVSRDDRYATVDEVGLVTGVALGYSDIVASHDGDDATTQIEVVLPLKSVTLFPKEVDMRVGEAQAIMVTVKDTADNYRDDYAPSWSTSDVSVAEIDKGGYFGSVSARGPGTSLIRVAVSNLEARLVVRVTTAPSLQPTLIPPLPTPPVPTPTPPVPTPTSPVPTPTLPAPTPTPPLPTPAPVLPTPTPVLPTPTSTATPIITVEMIPAILGFTPTRFDFDSFESANKTLTIYNSGGETLQWNLAADKDWITLDPPNGTTTAGGRNEIQLSVDAGSIRPGTHTANIRISALTQANDDRVIPVTLTVPPLQPETNDGLLPSIKSLIAIIGGVIGAVAAALYIYYKVVRRSDE